jgi:hypothetical protein
MWYWWTNVKRADIPQNLRVEFEQRGEAVVAHIVGRPLSHGAGANFPKNGHWRRRTLGRINASSSEILERRFFEGSEHGVDTGLISTSTRLKPL